MVDNGYISSEKIKKCASLAGFNECGICTPIVDEPSKKYFRNWLENNFQGNMKYLENTDQRFNPALLLPDIKSVVMVLISYNTLKTQNPEAFYRVSKYAFGEDYHDLIKTKLTQMEYLLTQENPKIKTYSFVDSSGVWEKYWARKTGLGWPGKHTIIINKKYGSFCFLGGIFINATSEYDYESIDNCGSCDLCLTACPTNALISERMLDTRKCISCMTIENKNNLPQEVHSRFNNYIYGCDICQNICPYNENTQVKNNFPANEKMIEMKKEDWENITKDNFENLFAKSSIHRIGYKRLLRNIDYIRYSKNSDT